MAKKKKKYRTYGDIKPTSRLMELELIAFTQITGEEVEQNLELIDKKLAEEYSKLAYD